MLKANNINTSKYIWRTIMQGYIERQLEVIQKINHATTLMLQTQTNMLSDLEDMQKIITSCVEDVQTYMDGQAASDILQKIAKTEIDNKRMM